MGTTASDVTEVERLIKAAQLRDRGAFDALHERHCALVRGVVRAETGQRDAVDDLVQEVFLRAWTHLPALSDVQRFRPWLLQIARRVVIDDARRRARRPSCEHLVDGMGPIADGEQDGPDATLDAFDLAERLRVALASMSERDAMLLRLAASGQGQPHDIAAATGLSVTASKVALHRARRRLAGRLDTAVEPSRMAG